MNSQSHRAEAERLLATAQSCDWKSDIPMSLPTLCIAAAQVHATLALLPDEDTEPREPEPPTCPRCGHVHCDQRGICGYITSAVLRTGGRIDVGTGVGQTECRCPDTPPAPRTRFRARFEPCTAELRDVFIDANGEQMGYVRLPFSMVASFVALINKGDES